MVARGLAWLAVVERLVVAHFVVRDSAVACRLLPADPERARPAAGGGVTHAALCDAPVHLQPRGGGRPLGVGTEHLRRVAPRARELAAVAAGAHGARAELVRRIPLVVLDARDGLARARAQAGVVVAGGGAVEHAHLAHLRANIYIYNMYMYIF